MTKFKIAIGLFSISNLIDAFMTWLTISRGLAYELNPLMLYVQEQGWEYFFLIKVVISLLIPFIFWKNKEAKDIRIIAYVLSILYSLLAIYYIIGVLITIYLGRF